MKLHTGLTIWILLFLSAGAFAQQGKQPDGPVYQEPHRPQFHFSPQKGWMNDPNGLVYFDGEYHLFYQYYPDSTVWGPMHWGHAVSRDLIHWQHLPIALAPDDKGYIFSGSVVIDDHNSLGMMEFDPEKKLLIAIFTYHNMEYERAGRTDRESQAIAISRDKGRTWKKFSGNPVLPNKGDVDFRDPKVLWHEASKQWVMPLAVGDHLEIFTSRDMRHWNQSSSFGKYEGAHGGVWECPDLFPVKAPNGQEKWVLIQNMGRGAVNGGSGTQYFIGNFDGKTFTNDNPPDQVLWLDYGADNYAGVTYFNAPDNRRIFIGWMSNWFDYAMLVPTSPWRSAMTVPRDLRLIETPKGLRLAQEPVKELTALRGQETVIPAKNLRKELKINTNSVQQELELEFDLSKAATQDFGFTLSNSKGEALIVGYDRKKQEFYIDRRNSGITDFSKEFPKIHTAPLAETATVKIHALIDASSVEVFVNDGAIAMTELFFPHEDFTHLNLFTKNGAVKLLPSKVWALKSIWH